MEDFSKDESLNETSRGDIIFFLYDVTSEESFNNCFNVFKFVNRGNDSALIYLVGSCCDKGSRVIPIEKGRETVSNVQDGHFREICSKDGTGVKELMDEAIHHFLNSKTPKIVAKVRDLKPVKKGCTLL